jgi:hypothetical protein
MWTKIGGHPLGRDEPMSVGAEQERRRPKTPPLSLGNQPVNDFPDARDHHTLQK